MTVGLPDWLAPVVERSNAIFLGRYRAQAANLAASFPRSIDQHLRQGWEQRLGKRFSETNGSPVAAANSWINTLGVDLKHAKLTSAYDEQRIRDHAENYAKLCSRMRPVDDGLRQVTPARALEKREEFARHIGIEPPAGKNVTLAGAMMRLEDQIWWRRQLRKAWTRAAENNMRELGIICKAKAPYASTEAVEHRQGRARRMREWMQSSVMVNEAGEQLELLDIAEKSLANPALRRGEFMCRMRGFEEIAKDLGHVAEFVTLTAPSAFHATHSGGQPNERHQGRETVRDAQAWLCKMWARSRAKIKRLNLTVYGFRVAEPHHDGTPHWHLVLFCRPRDADTLRLIIGGHWEADYKDELKYSDGTPNETAREARRQFKRIDPGQGSATGYIAKYVSKNIDAAGGIGDEQSDETGQSVRSGIQRVATWASAHGIRQFQQIGGPPVGLWRECRRQRSAVADVDIERARKAADRGDWRAFIYSLSHEHIRAGRRTAVKIARQERAPFTQETPSLNVYGEERPPRIIGIRCASAIVITRKHTWRIEKKCQKTADLKCSAVPPGIRGIESESESDLGPVAITVRKGPPDGSYAWIYDVPYRPGVMTNDQGRAAEREKPH